ncbi:MAG TPA: helix-turn-helix transcriptional regulator [Bacilli bacterium]|nr:helix-turn-helix transcriptional regulator [Bacilli bacterium]
MTLISSRLGEVLYERRMTQLDLAKRVEEVTGEVVHKTVISELVNNKRTSINRRHMGLIAKTLGITDMNELFEINEDE